MPSAQDTLISVTDSLLAIIDVQDHFLAKLPTGESEALVRRIVWLVHIASALHVPIVLTAEDIATLGSIATAIVEALSDDPVVYDKTIFGLAGQDDILAGVRRHGRRAAILVGLETDVCVAQSALGLSTAGYRAAALTDATGSPDGGHESGLMRIRSAGISTLSVEALFYEWTRTVARARGLLAPWPPPHDLAL